MAVSEQIMSAIVRFFAQNGLQTVDVPILQPADPFLDVVGEDLRRRIFMTEDENGDALCLRPEFTIPVCLSHIEAHRQTPQHYAYLGEVFRQRRHDNKAANGFYQAGIEDLGDKDEARADAGSVAHALGLLRAVAPKLSCHVLVGDHALFDCVLSAFDVPEFWQRRLARCLGHDAQLHSVLADLAKTPPPLPNLPAPIVQELATGTTDGLVQLIEAEMVDHGFSPTASRTPQEIAHRLREKDKLTRLHFDRNRLEALERFLTIEVPLSQAVDTLAHFACAYHIALDDVLANLAARNKALHEAGIVLDDVRYAAAFGRPLDYYTSFVYEIREQAACPRILIGGGRYDRLLELLGARTPIPAVGFSLWLDRLEEILL